MNDLPLLKLVFGIALVGAALLVALIIYRFRAGRSAGRFRGATLSHASAAYQRFYAAYIHPDGNYGAWHDGLDDSLFEQMSPDERAQAEADMIRALPDWRAIIGLGTMRSEKAVEPLKRLQARANEAERVRIEQALMRIGASAGTGVPGAESREVLAARDRADQSARMDAAMALREFPSAETAAALLDAVRHDPDYLVRYHATSSLLRISSYSDGEIDAILTQLAPKLASPKMLPEAVARVEELIAGRPVRAAN